MMPTDQELIRRVCAHDSDAFELLSDCYREAVYRHVLGILHDRDAGEDVVQEVFLRIWTHAEQWHGHGNFKAWLFRIATNLSLNYLRTVRRRRQQPLELLVYADDEENEAPPPGWLIDTASPEPDELLEQAERGKLLKQLINGLPDEKREVFHLVHDAKMEIKQIAELLGIPQGTVKSRLHYASRRLASEWSSVIREWEEM